VPPIGRAVLAQLVQPEKAGGATKQVEGELTRVVISSFEPGFRWPRLLDGAGWLPEPLALTDAGAATDDSSVDGESLPDFRDSDDDLRAKFDAAIKSMKCDGTLDAMITKAEYFGPDAKVWGDAGKEGC